METANRRWADVAQLACAQSAVDARRLAHEGRAASERAADRLPIRLLRHRLASLARRLPRRIGLLRSLAAVCDSLRAAGKSIRIAGDVDAAIVVESALVRAGANGLAVDDAAVVPDKCFSNAGRTVAVVFVPRVFASAKRRTDAARSAIRAAEIAAAGFRSEPTSQRLSTAASAARTSHVRAAADSTCSASHP